MFGPFVILLIDAIPGPSGLVDVAIASAISAICDLVPAGHLPVLSAVITSSPKISSKPAPTSPSSNIINASSKSCLKIGKSTGLSVKSILLVSPTCI